MVRRSFWWELSLLSFLCPVSCALNIFVGFAVASHSLTLFIIAVNKRDDTELLAQWIVEISFSEVILGSLQGSNTGCSWGSHAISLSFWCLQHWTIIFLFTWTWSVLVSLPCCFVDYPFLPYARWQKQHCKRFVRALWLEFCEGIRCLSVDYSNCSGNWRAVLNPDCE